MKTRIFYSVERGGVPVPLDGKKRIDNMEAACVHFDAEAQAGGEVHLVRYTITGCVVLHAGATAEAGG